MNRPKPGDYAQYYEQYISEIKGSNILKVLESQLSETIVLLKSVTEEKGNYKYAEGKWTIKEVIGHFTDTERIFAYRALCFARGETKVLPGFEQDDYVNSGKFNEKPLSDLINEFRLLRESNLVLFKSFNADSLAKAGRVEDNRVTVLAILFIIAGHTRHHLKIIEEKYLN